MPLDHVLASEEWAVLGCKTGPNVGSDHLPLIVDVELRTLGQPRGCHLIPSPLADDFTLELGATNL